ncbi:glycosyltransferase family 2 protein [Pectobacterium sp. CHL-2024]|uniref:glycosyltransferase family 2 protein n=1 Tax=Pectobacterium sp. CHL-2024 TaxID=3377079 RepID=UPI0037F9EE32
MNIMFMMGIPHIDTNKEKYPLYLTEVSEGTILEQQIKYTQQVQPRQLLFCVKDTEIKQFHTDAVIQQIEPTAKIIPIHAQTKGAICTALLGVEFIDSDQELILMAIDDFMENDSGKVIEEFRKVGADAGVVSFNSVHPRYSFAKLDEEGIPIEFSEKHPISKNALVSFYYFKHGSDFVECAKEVIRKDNAVNGNFYISQTLNEMILKQKKISIHKINNENFHPLKTETQLAEYIYEYKEKKASK